MTDQKLSKNKFSIDVEMYAIENDLSYIDSITEHCEMFGIDIDEVPKLMSRSLKDKLQQEAIKNRKIKE